MTFEFAAGEMTSVDRNCDTLVGMSFHIPMDNQDLPELQDQTSVEEEEKDQTEKKNQKKEFPAKKFYKMILPHIDASGKSDLPVRSTIEI